MRVGNRTGIETLQPVDHADGNQLPLLLEKVEVAVDRTEGEIRDAGLELGVDPFCAGMGFCAADTLQNGAALFTVFSGRHGFQLLNNNNSYF